jgi:hypothetical protein
LTHLVADLDQIFAEDFEAPFLQLFPEQVGERKIVEAALFQHLGNFALARSVFSSKTDDHFAAA